MPGTSRLATLGLGAILLAWLLLTGFPLYWVALTSLKSPELVARSTPTFLPFVDFQPTFRAYAAILAPGSHGFTTSMTDLWRLVRNSTIASVGGASVATLLGMLAAYALSRFRYRRVSGRTVMGLVLAQRMLPPFALGVPYFVLAFHLGVLDSPWTLAAIYAQMNLPLVIWLLYDSFADLPREVEEAALVDGCSHLGALWRVALPLARPAVLVAFLFAFVFSWNELFFALTLSLDEKTLPVQIIGRAGGPSADVAAQCMVVMLPPLAAALLVGRSLVRGLTLGAVR